jgi:hypothetical protein
VEGYERATEEALRGRLWTSRYHNRLVGDPSYVAVRITLGAPKFPLSYPLDEHVPELAPDGSMMQIDDRPRFERRFFEKLDRVGVAVIHAKLEAIRRRHPGKDLVLLCYENVKAPFGEPERPADPPGEWCHRLCVARWWLRETGEVIEELPDTRGGMQRLGQENLSLLDLIDAANHVAASDAELAASQALPKEG